ncbi:MAG: Replicative DNA helicase [Acidobacteria bacterium ADurb.Bin340]|nr:MAG: Replicative DNA helicase [Acidobacteria bacterium ADurb.Bin340]
MAEWTADSLPEDLESERALLATCCAPGAEVVASEIVFQITEEDFVHPAHQAVFKALRDLLERQVEVNSLTLKDALSQAGDLGRVGGYPGLVELLSAEEVGRPQVLADILTSKRKLRQLIRLGSGLARQASAQELPPDQLVEQAAQDLFRLAQGQQRKGLEHVGQVAQESMEALLDRLEGRGTTGLKVGFSRLDAITQGFQPGNLIILAARPGIGKTALALNWLLRSADSAQRAHAAFFSLEMSREEVFTRILAAKASINMKAVQAGAFDDAVQAKLLQARDELLQLPIFINDQAAITVREITAMVDRHLSQANQRLDLLIVDYLQLMSSPPDSRGAKQSEAVRIGEISRGFKLLAKDRGIPVVVLSQLNREVEHRQGGRPQLSDLRDSGAIEQDADMVMFIHRKMRPVVEGEPEDRSAELVIAKHRNGPTAIVPLYFEAEFARYRELERTTDEV